MNRTILGFLKKEFVQTLRDPRMRMLLFLAPIIQLTLFGVAISNDIKNVRLGVFMQPQDTVLQHIYDRCLASGWFIPAPSSQTDPYQQIQSGDAEAVLVAPEGGLTRSIYRGDGQLQLLVNATNAVRAQGIEQYVNTVIGLVTSDMNLFSPVTPPVQLDFRIFYNPTMETAVYMVPGVMCLLVCLLTIVLTSMSISREKEAGTFEMLIAAPVKPWEVILGKTLPYVLLGVSNIPLILIAAQTLFAVPMKGSLLVLGLSSLVFVCTTVSVGLLISTFARDQQQSMMGGFLFLFPANLLSGMMFPVENMPEVLKNLAYLNPLMYFVAILRNITLKGGEAHLILHHLAILSLMAGICMVVSFRRFNTTLQ